MKAKLKVGFSAKMQASSYNPVEQDDFIELEVTYDNEDELIKKYEKLQKLMRGKVINSCFEGVKEFHHEQCKVFNDNS